MREHVSAACLRKPALEVTPEERKLGKAVNFGFLYGQGERVPDLCQVQLRRGDPNGGRWAVQAGYRLEPL